MSSIGDSGTTEDWGEGHEEEDLSPTITLIFYHAGRAETIQLTKERPVVVGRGPPSAVIISHGSISRAHARFTLSDEGIHIEDLGSTNGTEVNGKRIDRAKVT